MGSKNAPKTPEVKPSIVIWIDQNIGNEENQEYLKELSKNNLTIKCFRNVKEAIDAIKTIKFKETKIIVSGRLFIDFTRAFIANLKDIYVIPKIIVFTFHKELFINKNKQYINLINHPYYNYGGTQTTFDEIKKFLYEQKNKIQLNKEEYNKQIKKYENLDAKRNLERMTFEYIDCREKLMLPLFFQSLSEKNPSEKIENYTISIYEKYSKKNENIYNLLDQIKSLEDIPIELLAKYYIRAYTIESDFYKDINTELGLSKISNNLPFIKVLYEAIKLKSLTLASDKELYRGSKMSYKEIEKIKEYLKNKKENLPAAIVFSKSFLSFSKEKKIAEQFYGYGETDNNSSRVLFILDKEDTIDFSLSTHTDIEKLSDLEEEKEILFFPFSSFEIKDIQETEVNGVKGYEIKLLYLGKYVKDIENDKNIIETENILPESEFKKQLIESGFISGEKINNNNTKKIFSDYKKYQSNVNNYKNKFMNDNYIIGEFTINKKDINKKIRIMHSFGEYEKDNKIEEEKIEKEIMENIEVFINDTKIDFSYNHTFTKEGKYTIYYIFKNKLENISYMFSECGTLTTMDLSHLNTEDVTDMSYMFNECKSLEVINLANINTQKVTNISYMFLGCGALINIDLSNFNTQNVTNMSSMFKGCKSLKSLNLSNFDTQNVTYMYSMFSGCKSLKNIDISNFNTQKVSNMSYMFEGCNSLLKHNIIVKDNKILNELENYHS